jgi:hypothetical protein
MQALSLLSTSNSSGTINENLGKINASILFERTPMLMDYEKKLKT